MSPSPEPSMRHRTKPRLSARAAAAAAFLALAAGSAAAAPQALPAGAAEPVVALSATRVHLGDGQVLDEGVVVVRGGKVVAAGAGLAVPEGATRIRLEGELSPGLVALRDFSTARGEQVDPTRNVMPEADLGLAFDGAHRDARALTAEGITTVLLTAPGDMLVGGLAAVVEPSSGEVVKRGAMLCIGAGTRALAFNRYPTSTAAQYAELERLFASDRAAFQRARKAELPVLFDVTDRADMLRASELARKNQLTGALIGAVRVADVAEAVKASGLSFVVTPIQLTGWSGAAREVARAAKAGIRIGFAADAPDFHPVGLRTSAALCIQAGMPADAALRALTSDAAAIAGVGDRTGRIAAGYEADLVLWSGAPTDLSSRVLRVWNDGDTVYDAEREGGRR